MLGGREIERLARAKEIVIEPFHTELLRTNSYDVRLGRELKSIAPNARHMLWGEMLDTRKPPHYVNVPDDRGLFLLESKLVYLAHTIEVIGGGPNHVPNIHGRSTVARWGVMVHLCAGFGDAQWAGQYVLEMVNMNPWPILIPIGVDIAQISFEECKGGYDGDGYSSTYQDQRGARGGKPLTASIPLEG